VFDGVPEVENLQNNTARNYPSHLIAFHGKVYFDALSVDDYFGDGTSELYQTDGTDGGTQKVYTFQDNDLELPTDADLGGVYSAAGKLFFAVYQRFTDGAQLWQSSGNADSTRHVGPASNSLPVYSDPWQAIAVNDHFVFQDASKAMYGTSGGNQLPT